MSRRTPAPTRFDVVAGDGQVLTSRDNVDQALAAAAPTAATTPAPVTTSTSKPSIPTGCRQRLLALP